jgi:hypothetical protein
LLTVVLSLLLLAQAVPGTALSAGPSASPTAESTAQPNAGSTVSPARTETDAAPTTGETVQPAAGAFAPIADPTDTASPFNAENEVVARRTATSRTSVNADGTFTTEIFSQAIHYRPDGSTEWEPIDLTFAPIAPGSKVAKVDGSPTKVTVAPANDAGGFLVLQLGGQHVALKPATPATSAVAPTLDGAQADVPDIAPGVDLRVFASADGVNAFLVLDEAPAEPSFTFIVDAPNLELSIDKATKRLLLKNAQNVQVGSFLAPYAIDSTPDEATGGGRMTTAVSYSLTKIGGKPAVTVSVDPAWLASAAYPVYIDPTIYSDGSNTYGDAHVNQGNPTFNYANYKRPDSPYYYEMWLGESPSNSTYYNEAFIKFDLSSVAGTTIDIAELQVYPYHQYYNAPTSTNTWLRRVTSTWAENTITWNTKPTVTTTGTVVDGLVEGARSSFIITDFVQGWVSGTYANHGLRLDENGNGPTYWKRLVSSEQGTNASPRLNVTYHVPTATPTTPTGPRNSRTLSWSYSDSGGDPQSHYEIDVDNNSDFSSLTYNGPETTGAGTTAAIPGTVTLNSGTTYYWRIRVKDGTSWSAWSSTSFVWDATAPLATVAINSGSTYATATGVTLNVTSSDAHSGVATTQASNDNSTFTAVSGTGPAWTLTSANGTKTVWYRVTDAAGNVTTVSDTIGLDTVNPTATIAVNSGAATTTSASVTLNVTSSDATSGVATTAASNDNVTYAPVSGSAPAWTLTAGDGLKTVWYRVTDVAGRTTTVSDTITLNTDTTAPNPPSIPDLDAASDSGVSATDDITSNAAPTFTGTAEAGSTVNLYSDGILKGSATANGSGAWTVTTSALTDGTHSITATATDTSTNTSAPSGPLTVTVDTVAPAAPSTPDLGPASDTGGSSTDDRTTDDTPTLTGTAEGDSLVTLLEGSTSLGTTSAVGGSWSITSSSLADGAHSLTAVAADAAGNSGPPSGAIGVTVVPAEVSLLWPAPDGLLFEEETLAGETIGDPVASVEFLIDGLVVGTAQAQPFEITWDTTTVTAGTHVFEARATLSAGGSVTSTPVTAIVDNTLSSVERLDADFATNRMSADEYALNGVYAVGVGSPLVLPERYRATSVGSGDEAQLDYYLAQWGSLSQETQDEVNAFLSQPLRGTFFLDTLLPVTKVAAQPIGITDPCEFVETRQAGSVPGPIIGTKFDCTHETANQNFVIRYVIDGTGIYADDSVVSAPINGVPDIISQYAIGVEDAYDVYANQLAWPTGWQGQVPVIIHHLDCGECGQVMPFGVGAGGFLDSVQPIEMAPAVGQPKYLAHHETFHVFQSQYAGPQTLLWILLNPIGAGVERVPSLRWLSESTADWAAGYVERSGKPVENGTYTKSLANFLGEPNRRLNHFDGALGGRQYGAWIFHEYLVEALEPGPASDPAVIKEIFELIEQNQDPIEAIDAVVVSHGTTYAQLLPDFWRATYLLDYDDTVAPGSSDVESTWAQRLDDDQRTEGDALAPPRPARDTRTLQDGVAQSGEAHVEPGGARYLELAPSQSGPFGEFVIEVDGIARNDLSIQVLVVDYPPAIPPNPRPFDICVESPLTIETDGTGSISVPLTPDCRHAVVIFSSTHPYDGDETIQWTARFDRKTVVMTDDQWKTLELSWQGGATNPEPSGWMTSGFDDSAWSAAYIPQDPYHSWVDINYPHDPDWLSSTGRSTGHLTSEIWIARLEFTIDGDVAGDGQLQWNVDNWASIWINGQQLTNHSGTWSSVTTTTVPQALLQSGTNTIAVKVFQDGNTNTWSANPTFFQGVLSVPTE